MSKEAEYRQYLLQSGMFDSTLKLLVALAEKPDISDAETLLKDYFGYVRDPVWDEITRLTESSTTLRGQNETLEIKMKELSSELATLRAADICAKLWDAMKLGPSAVQASKKQIVDNLNGSDLKATIPDIQTLIPEQVTTQELLEYLQLSEDARRIASSWLGTDGVIIPWGNQLTEDLTLFWTTMHATPLVYTALSFKHNTLPV